MSEPSAPAYKQGHRRSGIVVGDCENNPKSIKYHVRRYIEVNRASFEGRTVLDFPAGSGVTSRILRDVGARVVALDAFPHLFEGEGVECRLADASSPLPLEDESIDAIICQEGLEHFTDQFLVLSEFSRVLKRDGLLVLTTPNYSNIQSRLSYLVSESEDFLKLMPPNEADSVWLSNDPRRKGFYFGHLFLTGFLRLRVVLSLSGFDDIVLNPTRVKTTSLILGLVLYPVIFVLSLWGFLRSRHKAGMDESRQALYRKLFWTNLSPLLLTHGHIFISCRKRRSLDDARAMTPGTLDGATFQT